ncbi:longifolia [Dionaea muscipula]
MVEEKERNSTELPRASRSNSDTSTFSSRDRSRNTYQGRTSHDSRTHQGNASHTYHQTNLQDGPKEFIQGPSSSYKAVKEQEPRPIKHIDSPRPRYSSTLDKQKNSALYEPKTGQNVPPASVIKRNTDRLSVTKDRPRLSFDERESRDSSTSSPKLELPRLSLDSRRQAITRTTSGRNYDLVPIEVQKEEGNHRRDVNLQQDPVSDRPISSIVTKLMGLEALSDYRAVPQGQAGSDKYNVGKNLDTFSKSSRSRNERDLNQTPNSPRNHQTHSNSPRMRNAISTESSQPYSRTSSETAPLKQWEEHLGSEESACKHHKDNKDPQNLSLSIYGEIEKRLSELDFQNSGTDLRALKQIVAGMQKTRSKLNIRQETKAHDGATLVNNSDSNYMSSNQGPRYANCQNLHGECKITMSSKGSRSAEDILHQDLAIKPDKLLPNSAEPTTFIIQDEASQHLPNLRRLRTRQLDGKLDPEKKQATKILANNPHFQDPLPHSLDAMDNCPRVRKVAPEKTPKLPKHTAKDEMTRLNKSIVTVRNFQLENQLHFPGYSDSMIIKKHKMQQVESGTSPRRITPKATTGGNISSKTTSGSTWSSQQGKSASQIDIKMVKEVEPAVTNQPSMQNRTLPQVDNRESSMDGPTLKIAIAVQEQPSPVSVLDVAFYGDECPSPVKKKSFSYKDYETPISLGAKLQTANVHHLSDNPRFGYGSESDSLECRTIQHIDQKPWQHKSIQEKSQDSSISLSQGFSAEERYLFEILLASGFISELDFNLSDKLVTRTTQAINRKLFSVVEQTRSIFPSNVESTSSKGNATSSAKVKLERRLIFDVANEILVQNLSSDDHSLKLSPLYNKKPGGYCVSGPQLLRELSEEIRSLQANSLNNRFDSDEGLLANIIEKDLMNGSGDWTLSSCEISGLVLDIERLIFKDFVVELLDN